jgi:radical SAM superfamily enzyme YgiQ (UPF0313 family)
MRVCFVQKQAFPYFGVMSLAGSLKSAGIESDSLIANLEEDLIGRLSASAPDLIAFSVLSMEHAWLEKTAAEARAALPDIPIVVGGIHAILYPEAILSLPAVDYVCTGEGEVTLPLLCRVLRDGGDVGAIRGIGHHAGGRPVLNEREEPIADVGEFREDRTVYYRRYATLKSDEQKQFIASRGCPYECAFCFNRQLHALFPGQGNRVRMKRPAVLIEEIEAVRSISPVGAIFFADDLFASDKGWLRDFVPLYKERIGIPFMCITRADRMDEETAALLKEAGCHTVSFGIESGRERIRREILKKTIGDASIIRCAEALHRNGIRIQTSNMFCLPDETLEDAFETVRLNIRIGADFVYTPLFMPFPGTELAAYCVAHGYLPADFGLRHLPQSFLAHSILDHPDRTRIENLQRIAFFLVRFPGLRRIAEVLVRRVTWPWLYAPFLYLGTVLRYRAERGLSWWGALRFLWRFRRSV